MSELRRFFSDILKPFSDRCPGSIGLLFNFKRNRWAKSSEYGIPLICKVPRVAYKCHPCSRSLFRMLRVNKSYCHPADAVQNVVLWEKVKGDQSEIRNPMGRFKVILVKLLR